MSCLDQLEDVLEDKKLHIRHNTPEWGDYDEGVIDGIDTAIEEIKKLKRR